MHLRAGQRDRLTLFIDTVHQPDHSRDFAAKRARVHHQAAADAARDTLAELKSLEAAIDRILNQRAELRGRTRADLHVVELQAREALAQVDDQSAHAAIADQQIGARAQAECRHARAPRRRHRSAQFVFALDREQDVGGPPDPKRGKLGERRAGTKTRAKAGA